MGYDHSGAGQKGGLRRWRNTVVVLWSDEYKVVIGQIQWVESSSLVSQESRLVSNPSPSTVTEIRKCMFSSLSFELKTAEIPREHLQISRSLSVCAWAWSSDSSVPGQTQPSSMLMSGSRVPEPWFSWHFCASPSCIAGANPGADLVELASICSRECEKRVRPIAFLLWSVTFWLFPQSKRHQAL